MTKSARQQEREVQRLMNQVDAIAASFGWDPSENWVQEIKRQIGYYEPSGSSRNDIHQLTYTTYRMFDPRTYYSSGSTPKITARYTAATDPNPLDIADRCMYDPRTAEIGKIVVGSHDTTIYDEYGFPMFIFYGFGRKMHYGSAERAEDARQLIKELIGLDMALKNIAVPDMNHFYELLVLTKDTSGAWSVAVGDKVRA
jgi:hypothetical protein